MAQKHKNTKTFQLLLKAHIHTHKKVRHYSGIICKLLPSVSKDKSHPKAADERTSYMLITGGKLILSIRLPAAVQSWQSNSKVLNPSFMSWETGKRQDFYLQERMQWTGH